MSPQSKHEEANEESFDDIPDVQSAAELFKLLDDANRLKIFWILCRREESVSRLAEGMKMSPPAVSHHLKLLKSGGLIVSRRIGKEVCYTALKTIKTNLLKLTLDGLIQLTRSPEKNDTLT